MGENLPGLFTQTEFFDQFAVACKIVFLKVIQQALALTYQLHEPTMSGKIFFVLLQMAGNLADPLC